MPGGSAWRGRARLGYALQARLSALPVGERQAAPAKVFTTGNSQAVRPKAFRVESREVWITRNERTGEITLKPEPDVAALQAFLDQLRSPPASDEFVPHRSDAPQPDPLAG